MVDILHRIGTTAPLGDVYAAVSTIDGLAGWWTADTGGDATVGGKIEFRFQDAPPPGGFDMLVRENEAGQRVVWEVVGGADEWIGTTIYFELSTEDDYTIVLFSHRGWREPVPFMHHCSTKWATFLMSLKALVETGTGEAAPNDVRISNWH
ncbi:SRPBCC family protein [Microlunatus speluncae]|uniref:SRPBCC family protein n=1 Tax=Microlunatus speluncae TaxID=2594267 RepID=UPI001266144F|nr:SRPBCC domain-containing protein [Microlunatus speluncae]